MRARHGGRARSGLLAGTGAARRSLRGRAPELAACSAELALLALSWCLAGRVHAWGFDLDGAHCAVTEASGNACLLQCMAQHCVVKDLEEARQALACRKAPALQSPALAGELATL